MRVYTTPHQFYGGIDWHARTMYLCILNQDGEILGHRNMKAAPEPVRKTMAPYREDLGGCVERLFMGYGLAALCAREAMAFGLGHARYMKAIHGGKAKHDTIDAPKIAVLRRGGMLPQASGDPAEMRATRDLLRRRMSLMRQRAALLTHVQQTNRQYNLPGIGKHIADQANREGVAARFPAPASQQRLAVDRARLGPYDQRLTALELAIGTAAKAHNAPVFYRLRSSPGVGKSLALVLLDESHDRQRLPRGQEFVSYCRLVTGATASAGKRSGT
jgi:transposase